MLKSWYVPVLALTAATAVGLGAGLWWHHRGVQSANPYEHLGGDFTLASGVGPVSLEDYRGRAVMLFFGYTTCPDVCPMDLAKISAVINQFLQATHIVFLLLFFQQYIKHRSVASTKKKSTSFLARTSFFQCSFFTATFLQDTSLLWCGYKSWDSW